MRAARIALSTLAAVGLSAAATRAADSGGASLNPIGATTVSTTTSTAALSASAPSSSGGAPLPTETRTTTTTTTTTTVTTTASAITQTISPLPPFSTTGGISVAATDASDPYVYSVAWTCAGRCVVAERRGPDTSSPVASRIAGGNSVTILCQTHGSTVHSRAGSSDVWDRLTDGEWVPDAFLTTPSHGTVSPGLPSCLLATLG
jgi:hypothetical protein